MLAVLGAIDALQPATLVQIAARTGLDKKTVTTLIDQARNEAEVTIDKTGPNYVVSDWGPYIKKSGVKKALTGALNAPIIEG